MARSQAKRTHFGLLCIATLASIGTALAQNTSSSTELDAETVSAAPAAEPASGSSQSAECQKRLAQLNFKSNLQVVLIQLSNTNQVINANAQQLQLLAKGPHLPGLMTTCGGPGVGLTSSGRSCVLLLTAWFIQPSTVCGSR